MSLNVEVGLLLDKGIKIPDPRNADNQLTVTVDKSYILPKIANSLHNDLFDFVYTILGKQPMVNLIGYHEEGLEEDFSFDGLPSFELSFGGIERPCKRNGEDSNIIILILKPKYRYKYIPHMVCVAKIEDVPEDVGMAVYIRETLQNNAKIIKWEWIECGDDGKPLDHENRYNQEF